MKITRIPVVVFAVFQLGYQQGMVEYATNPQKKEAELLASVLSEYGVHDVSTQVDCQDEHRRTKALGGHSRHYDPSSDPRLVQLVQVGSHIVKAALQKLELDIDNHDNNHDNDNNNNNHDNHAELEELLEGHERLRGSWDFVLIHSKIPNAFVSEVFPHRIFVTTGLFDKFVDNQDELALVLGHEISHLICQHRTTSNFLQLSLRSIEILFLSLDPTEGFLSLIVMGSLHYVRQAVESLFSRDHEIEADTMGIQIAAMACYDTKRASQVFYKMHQHDVKTRGESAHHTTLLSTHPASLQRYEHFQQLSHHENRDKYSNSTCRGIQQSFWNMLRQQKSNSN